MSLEIETRLHYMGSVRLLKEGALYLVENRKPLNTGLFFH